MTNKEFEITFKDAYEGALQPITAKGVSEVNETVHRLHGLGYFDIKVVEISGHDRKDYAAEVLARRFTISDMVLKGESAYYEALEQARSEMFTEIGVRNYSYNQVFDYAMEQEFLFDLHGHLKNR